MQTMTQQQPIHRDHNYLVVGLGLTGYATAAYLLQHGYRCQVQDDRVKPPYLDRLRNEYPHAPVLLQPLDQDMIDRFDCWVVSPGLSIRTGRIAEAALCGVRVIGDIELFSEAVNKPVLAITGSNGKSTVTALLAEMIRADDKRAAVGANFGIPALELLDQQADFYVLELSSFQLETTSGLQPVAATVLNVSEDHMDRYRDLDDYRRSKLRIYSHAVRCISNADDDLTRHDENDLTFSIQHERADFHISQGVDAGIVVQGETLINVDQVRLKGRHNLAKCLAATALALQAGISRNAIVQALQSFAGLPHRSQWVAEINGVTWINDSKATNPGAARAAIEGLDEPIILLAGGQSKGADLQSLCETVREHLCCMLVFGEDAELIQSSLTGCCAIERVDDLAAAVRRATEIAQPGDVVLLSPACASFDQFSGFAQRGERFMQLVREVADHAG